ncbi:MAG TPA: MFS transporter [Opitutaceae bacterium]|nr:MFS transporter [Opitutaceae bacterium]
MNGEPKVYHVGTLSYTKGALAVLFAWLLWGDFCFILMETIVPSIMPLKLQALGAPNTILGLFVTTIPRIIDTLFNPIISFKSDRHRGRFGRRIPFIFFTLPFLVVCLVGLGFSEKIAAFLHHRLLNGLSATTVTITVIGVTMTLFSFFNTFVNSVFWYLFNDVVPEQFLSRFMSWFRMVSMGAASLYSLFIFKHAATHSTEIIVGAGALYFFGFGLMCLKVKEGAYPPPPTSGDGAGSAIAAVKTYGRECLGLSHYWYLFLANMGIVVAYSASIFSVFFYKSVGLALEDVGRLAFADRLAMAVAMPVAGWLADRYHPIRIVIAGLALQVLVSPIMLIWLFWQPSTQMVFYVLLGSHICLFSPIMAMFTVIDPPLAMRIFPRDRYGQFCSANGMLRSLAAIVAGVLVGVFLDAITAHWDAKTAYCSLPLWNMMAYALALFAIIKLYRSWQRYGGDSAYYAPLPSIKVDASSVAAKFSTQPTTTIHEAS